MTFVLSIFEWPLKTGFTVFKWNFYFSYTTQALYNALFGVHWSVCLFDLRFYAPVNSYDHVEMVSTPKHTFSWASLTKPLTSN